MTNRGKVNIQIKIKIHLPDVKKLDHEVDDRLGLVEGCGAGVDVERHLPVGGPHALVVAKPNLK